MTIVFLLAKNYNYAYGYSIHARQAAPCALPAAAPAAATARGSRAQPQQGIR